jgi:PAS domain S-box-containing protein
MLKMRRMLDARVALVLVSGVVYALVSIPLYQMLGPMILMVGTIPVMIAGWLLGRWAGLFAGLLTSLLDMLLLILVGEAGWDIMIRSLPGFVLLLLVGFVVGRLHDLGEQVKQELAERVQAEEALRESEEKYRTILENIEEGYYEVDVVGNLTFFNDPLCRLYRYPKDELMGLNYRQYMDDETAKMVYQTFNAVHRTGKPTKAFDWEVIRKDGTRRFVEVSVSLMRGPTGEPAGFRGLIRDITERKRAEEAIHQYVDIVNNMQVGLQVYQLEAPEDDRSLRMMATNPAATMFTGLAEEDVVGKRIDEVFPGLREAGIPQTYADVVRTGMPVEFEHEVYYDEEHMAEAWLSLKAFPLPNNCVAVLFEDITLAKQAEESLRQSQIRYRAILEDQTELVCRLLPDGRLVFVNEACGRYFGSQRDGLIAQSLIPLLFEEDQASFQEHLTSLSVENPVATNECRAIRSDGETGWLRWTGRAIFDEQGGLMEYQLVGRDVTELKRAEQALRVAEERFALAVRGSNDGIWDWSILNNSLYWSPRLKELLGYADDELDVDFDTFESHLHPDDGERMGAAIEAHLEDRELYDVEQRLRTKSGEYRWFRARGQALWDEEGNPIRMVGSTTDITERKRAEEALAEERNLLRTLIDNMPDFIFVKDTGSRFVINNKAHVHVLGATTQEEVLGKTDFDIFPQELAAQYYADEQEVIRSGQALINREEPYINEEGDQRWLSTTKVPLRDSHDGRMLGLVGLSRDITEHKQADEQLEHYAAELERANEEVKQFAYIVSHDLRAPLVNLKGFSAELRCALEVVGAALDTALPHLDEKQQRAVTLALEEDVPEALGFIDSSVTRMDRFINALLKLSRMGRRELHLEAVDMEPLVQATLQTLAHQIEERQVKVTVGPMPQVIADRTSMEQIMGNILGNAVKYLEPDRLGEIEITAERGDDETTFRIRDNGRGIAAGDMPKVFTPFRRAGRQDVPGEGMGLAYVQALVRRHDGRIGCESELGVGTTFSFTIPAPPPPQHWGE